MLGLDTRGILIVFPWITEGMSLTARDNGFEVRDWEGYEAHYGMSTNCKGIAYIVTYILKYPLCPRITFNQKAYHLCHLTFLTGKVGTREPTTTHGRYPTSSLKLPPNLPPIPFNLQLNPPHPAYVSPPVPPPSHRPS